jgi:hypothetical protein
MYKEFWKFYITDNEHVTALYAFKVDTVWNEWGTRLNKPA